MKNVLLVSFVFIFLFSCSKSQLEGNILIRIKNQTAQKIEDVSVYSIAADMSREVERKYGSVKSNSATMYLPHEYVYDYPLLKYTVPGSGVFEITSMRCAVGVGNLSPGKYSLVISDDVNSRMIYFQRD